MNPCAIEGIEVVADGEEGLTLRHPRRGEVQLRGVAATVWRHIDGARSPEELATALGAEADAVWAALDELGDAELLTERVTPPEGIHENVRREVVFASETVSSGDAELAGTLEAQFDAEAARDAADIELPQAEEHRAQQEAAREAEAAAAAAAAMSALDSRPDDAAASPEPTAEAAPPALELVDPAAQAEPAEVADATKTAD